MVLSLRVLASSFAIASEGISEQSLLPSNGGTANQKLANEDRYKRHIDGIAAKGKNAVHDELVGMIGVDADPEALPEGIQAP